MNDRDFTIALNWKAMRYAALKNYEDSAMNICDAIPTAGMKVEGEEPCYRFFDRAYAILDEAKRRMDEELLPILRETGYGDAAEALLYYEE